MCMLQESQDSMILIFLEQRDEVMADRRFTISEDLLLRPPKLHVPPGKCGQEQFSKSEVKKTKEIANLRIYVEQAIRRLKTFCLIKNELPISTRYVGQPRRYYYCLCCNL